MCCMILFHMVYWAKTLTPIYCFYLLTINRLSANIYQWICDCVCSFHENEWPVKHFMYTLRTLCVHKYQIVLNKMVYRWTKTLSLQVILWFVPTFIYTHTQLETFTEIDKYKYMEEQLKEYLLFAYTQNKCHLPGNLSIDCRYLSVELM